MLKSRRYRLFFFLLLIADLATGQELVKDINTTTYGQTGGVFADRCKPCGGYVYFLGHDVQHGDELWSTDGTTSGTNRLSDFDDDVSTDAIVNAPCFNNKFYYATSAGTWEASGATLTKVSSNKAATIVGGELAYIGDDESSVFVNETLINKFTPNEGFERVSVTHAAADGNKLYLAVLHSNPDAASVSEVWVWSENSLTLLNTSRDLPDNFVVVQDILYFDGTDDDHGKEMWASNGTPEGTTMLTDGVVGADGSNPVIAKVIDNKVIYYSVVERNTWASSGTAASTSLILPGYVPQSIAKHHSKIYFSGSIASDNIGLMRTDLDFSNPETVLPDITSNGYNAHLTNVADKLLYSHYESAYGMELFEVHDDLSVTLFKDINPGTGSSAPASFAELGNKSVFLADDGVHLYEWWVTDGTPANTFIIEDIAEGTQSPDMSEVYQFDKKLYFIARSTATDERQLWRSDGTNAGTYQIFADPALSKDMLFGVNQYVITTANGFVKIDVQAEDATPLSLPDGYTNYVEIHAQPGLSIGDLVYFNTAAGPSPEETGGLELWTANVSTNEIAFVKDINPGPEGSVIYSEKPKFNGMGVVLGDKIIFPAKTSAGMEPWVSDGTDEGTFMLKDIRGSGDSFPKSFTVVGDKVYFIALSDEEGMELWITDGTSEGTHLVKDAAPGPVDGITDEPLAFYGSLFFSANDKLWITDGTEEATHEYETLLPDGWSKLRYPVACGDYLYFLATHPDHGPELWSTDGTLQGTTLLEITPGAEGSLIDDFITSNGTLYFSTHGKIWRSLGTPETTVFLGEANPVSELMLTENYLCFQLDDPFYGRELFRVSLTGPVGQLITFDGFTNLQPGNEYNFSVSASSGLPVAVTSSDPSIIEVAAGKLIVHKPGTVTFTASQGGDVNFKSTTETLTIEIPRLTQTITFAAIANKTMLDDPFNVDASSSAGLHLSFTSSDISIAEVSDEGRITIKKAGTVTITASRDADDIYDAPQPVSRTFTISKITQTVNFGLIANRTISDGSILLQATSSSGLPVTFESDSDHISIAGDLVSFLLPGTVTIVALQGGDNVYDAATPVVRTFCINPPKAVVTQAASGSSITLTSSGASNIWLLNNTPLSATASMITVADQGFYKAAEIADGCQGEFSEAVEVLITGLEEEMISIVLYPNPVAKTLFVKTDGQASVQIIDISGREKFKQSVNSDASVDVSGYAPGVYFVIINNTRYLKFVKQ